MRNFKLFNLLLSLSLLFSACTGGEHFDPELEEKRKKEQEEQEEAFYKSEFARALIRCDMEKVKDGVVKGLHIGGLDLDEDYDPVGNGSSRRSVLSLVLENTQTSECFDYIFPRIPKETLQRLLPIEIEKMYLLTKDASPTEEQMQRIDYYFSKLLNKQVDFPEMVSSFREEVIKEIYEKHRDTYPLTWQFANGVRMKDLQKKVDQAFRNYDLKTLRELKDQVSVDYDFALGMIGFDRYFWDLYDKQGHFTESDIEDVDFVYSMAIQGMGKEEFFKREMDSNHFFWIEFYFRKNELPNRGHDLDQIYLDRLNGNGYMSNYIIQILLKSGLDPDLVNCESHRVMCGEFKYEFMFD